MPLSNAQVATTPPSSPSASPTLLPPPRPPRGRRRPIRTPKREKSPTSPTSAALPPPPPPRNIVNGEGKGRPHETGSLGESSSREGGKGVGGSDGHMRPSKPHFPPPTCVYTVCTARRSECGAESRSSSSWAGGGGGRGAFRPLPTPPKAGEGIHFRFLACGGGGGGVLSKSVLGWARPRQGHCTTEDERRGGLATCQLGRKTRPGYSLQKLFINEEKKGDLERVASTHGREGNGSWIEICIIK